MKPLHKVISVFLAALFIAGAISRLPQSKKFLASKGISFPVLEGPEKKKILIFSSKGGGGHVAVTSALREYLHNDYTVEVVDIFSEVLLKMDPMYSIMGDRFTGVDTYNSLLQKKWHTLVNMLYKFGAWYYDFRKAAIEKILIRCFKKYKPDLVISAIPLVNKNILAATKKLDIPFLLIPTDLDPFIALNRFKHPSYDKFKLALSYDDPTINDKVAAYGIHEKYVEYVGFPVKSQFFKPQNSFQTKSDFDLPHDKPIVLVLMGAQGSTELVEYARSIAKSKTPLHLVIAIGKSESVRKPLNRLVFPKHITHTIIGFTDRIPEIMQASDLIFSKSGSVSVNEAIYANLPIYLDATSTVLNWEQCNHDFITSRGLGGVVKRYYNIPTIVDTVLGNPEELEKLKANFKAFEKKDPRIEVLALVNQILEKPASLPVL